MNLLAWRWFASLCTTCVSAATLLRRGSNFAHDAPCSTCDEMYSNETKDSNVSSKLKRAIQPLTVQPLTGERLAAFCYLKQKLMPTYVLDPQPKDLKGHNTRCALVSSSGALLAHEHGEDIDGHDIVFRFNKAPVAGFVRWVGMKTSYRMGWDFPYDCPYHRRIYYPEEMQSNATKSLKHILPDAKKEGNKPHVSSGFHGMMTALSNCGSVDGYEITPSKAAAKSPYSYYSNWQDHEGGATYNSWHGYFKAEKKLWSLVSTTPEAEINETGKSQYTCFHAVTCDNVAALLAQMPPEMVSSLDELIQDAVSTVASRKVNSGTQ